MITAKERGWGEGWPNCAPALLAHRPVLGITLVVREEIADLAAALVTVWHAEVERLDPAQCWSYACRPIRGTSSTPSNHSWGLALDLNAAKHPLGQRKTFTAGQVSAIHTILGRPPFRHFKWGGDFLDRVDEMHVEYIGTPTEAAADTLRLQEDDMPITDADADLVAKKTRALLGPDLASIRGKEGPTDSDPAHTSIHDLSLAVKALNAKVDALSVGAVDPAVITDAVLAAFRKAGDAGT